MYVCMHAYHMNDDDDVEDNQVSKFVRFTTIGRYCKHDHTHKLLNRGILTLAFISMYSCLFAKRRCFCLFSWWTKRLEEIFSGHCCRCMYECKCGYGYYVMVCV